MFSGSLALVIALVITVILILWLRLKYETAGRKIVSLLFRVWYLILGWLGAGLASIGLAELLHNAGSSLSFGSSLLGPLAFLSLRNKFFVTIALAGWSVGLSELMNQTELTVHEGGKGSLVEVGRNLRKVVNKDAETAPGTKPEGAHFVQTEQSVSSHIIRENEQSSGVAIGFATLAPEWGKRKVDVDFGLPKEGSGQVLALAESPWVPQHHSVEIVGPTGVGETFLGCALTNSAIRRDYSSLYLRTPKATALFDKLILP